MSKINLLFLVIISQSVFYILIISKTKIPSHLHASATSQISAQSTESARTHNLPLHWLILQKTATVKYILDTKEPSGLKDCKTLYTLSSTPLRFSLLAMHTLEMELRFINVRFHHQMVIGHLVFKHRIYFRKPAE